MSAGRTEISSVVSQKESVELDSTEVTGGIMRQTPAPQGGLIVITAIFTFTAGILLARGEATAAVAMLALLAAAWMLAAVKSA